MVLLRAMQNVIRLTSRLKPQRALHSSATWNKPIGEDFYTGSSFTPPPPRTTLPAKPTKLPAFLKFSLFSALTAALGAAGYATYAYSADEIDAKTKIFRSSINHPLVDTDTTVENLPDMVYRTVMTVSSKAVEIYLDMRRAIEERLQDIAEPVSDQLLPDMDKTENQYRVMTLVLDLRGTLIYNEWKRETGWSTYKRPGLDAFLQQLCQIYEIVVYSDEYGVDGVTQKLMDKGVRHHLTRAATKYQDGKHYRDLSKLNRDPSRIIYVSGHALENCLQPENCISIKPWKKEVDDTTLIDIIPFLEYVGSYRPTDIRPILASYHGKDIPNEFIERSKRVRQKQKPNPLRRTWS